MHNVRPEPPETSAVRATSWGDEALKRTFNPTLQTSHDKACRPMGEDWAEQIRTRCAAFSVWHAQEVRTHLRASVYSMSVKPFQLFQAPFW